MALVAVAAPRGSSFSGAGATPQTREELTAADLVTIDPVVTSERLYLSGPGPDEPRLWEFRAGRGRRSGEWSTIPVPSNWELQGFGSYSHGKQWWWRPSDTGIYRTQFRVPEGFRGRRVELVFEGVMTDAEVRLNNMPLGPPHQGGFTRFAYDVSSRLLYRGPSNLLEVRVAEASADESVNRAERDADYWIFGGIYRPVYLESHPPASITWVGVDARHDGELAVEVEWVGPTVAMARLQVETPGGEPVGDELTARLGSARTTIRGRVAGIEPWSAEAPRLYFLRVELATPEGRLLHRRRMRFGFRTVELEPGRGLFVNGRRVLLKGVNRHSHWPETGRAVAAAVNRRDVELLKRLNANAVRTAHSPPDRDFLAACDELGLYVIDELPGWHDAYETEVGSRILWEMVRRDVNHPSVILWANGNEGGWNLELDPLFAELDPQRRPVIHPGERALGFDATHYPDWQELSELVAEPAAAGAPVVLPTELLHALYDGGGGASLADYWELLRSSPRAAGGFIWSLFDEGVVRTDRGGRIDTSGNRGADGLHGPHRQPEASHDAVRELWSPVRLSSHRFGSEAIEVELENRFDLSDLEGCTLRWRWIVFPDAAAAEPEAVSGPGGELAVPAAAPGGRASLLVPRPAGAGEAVEIAVFGPDGRELMVRVLADPSPDAGPEVPDAAGQENVRIERDGSRLVLQAAGGRRARFDLASGGLTGLEHGNRRLSLSGGARRADGRRARLIAAEVEPRSPAAVVRARFRGALDEVTWTFHPDGRLRLDYLYQGGPEDGDYGGIGLDYPQDRVRGLTWLGLGPYRVWRNRLAGARLRVWRKPWNETVTGVDWDYPEFQGFYAGVRWARLETSEGTLVLAPDPGLYLGLFAPRFPAGARNAVAAVPSGISVLDRISAIGTKFHAPEALGPTARRRLPAGPQRGGVWLRFGAVVADP